jgi:hypothetical protein
MSADQYKQIGNRPGGTSLNMRTVFIKLNGNFGNSQELKGRSEKSKNPSLFLIGAQINALCP